MWFNVSGFLLTFLFCFFNWLDVTWYMFELLASFFPCSICFLNKVVVISIEPKQIVPFLVILYVIFATIQCNFIISKEEVKCFDSC